LYGGFASSDVDRRTSRNKYDDVVGARRLECGGARWWQVHHSAKLRRG